ncbi:MAG TPA: phospholipid carrier-dependent glycosyltransferase [Bryobacteraceae bacterium]|nr:phospholipid carrier-dependent glycosyltransferase [Bryobacteraceae bacterium]
MAGVLVAAFMLQSLCASLRKSAVFDEPPHIASGLSYLETRVFHANPQHPPLLKELSAASLLLAGVRWPQTLAAQWLVDGGPPSRNLEWPIGYDILASNGPDRVLFWARLPMILLGGLLGALIFILGRQLAGQRAALFALFLYAFDPTLIAHSSLVTTDVGMAAFTVLFLFTLWRYVQAPGRLRLLGCGLALGAALASKFSALALLPVGAALLFAGLRRSGVAAGPAAETGPDSPCPCGSGRRFKRCHGSAGRAKAAAPLPRWMDRMAVRAGAAFLAMLAIAVVVIEAVYLFSSDPFLYLAGKCRPCRRSWQLPPRSAQRRPFPELLRGCLPAEGAACGRGGGGYRVGRAGAQ